MHSAVEAWFEFKSHLCEILYIYIYLHFSIFVAGCRLRSMLVKGEFRNRIRDMQNEK